MVYTAFLDVIRQMVQTRLGSTHKVQLSQFSKNNGLVLDGLSILPAGGHLAPTIYLNPYYALYLKDMTLEEIVDDILSIVSDGSCLPHIEARIMSDFSLVRSKVAFKLINTASNPELLSDLPHFPYLDLSIVFYLFLEKNDSGQMTALIHNDHLKLWRLSEEELYQTAMENTPRLLPSTLKTMREVMSEIAVNQLGEDYYDDLAGSFDEDSPLSPLYVLTNQTGLYGAGVMLYPNILKNFADRMGQDLVILPSSIHEVLLLPYDETVDFDSLNDMVVSINRSEVPSEDQLSNQIYFYNRSDNQITQITNSSVPVGTKNP